jgi:methylmalonyl-CoA mutase N-terminal domain/subunit
VVRVALQVLSAAFGGAQSIHANGYDEALALPTEQSAKLALRTQQVIAEETGITDSVDPLGGGWMVEALTAEIEEKADELIRRIDERGGAVDSIEFMRDEIADAAYRWHKAMEAGERKVVGINVQAEPEETEIDILKIDPAIERAQVARLATLRAARDEADVSAALDAVRNAARGTDNLLPPMHRALGARATIGEVCGVLREEFGEYDRMIAGRG